MNFLKPFYCYFDRGYPSEDFSAFCSIILEVFFHFVMLLMCVIFFIISGIFNNGHH